MSARAFVLARHEDPSGISGTGLVAEGVQWTGGSAELHWMTEWETWVHWPGGIDDILAVHGHDGATEVRWIEETPKALANERLLSAYRQVMFWLGREMRPEVVPLSVEPHPLWPDRLQAHFADESSWRLWIALMDGSTDAASHDQNGDNWTHSWVSADGNVWLTYTSNDTEDEQ